MSKCLFCNRLFTFSKSNNKANSSSSSNNNSNNNNTTATNNSTTNNNNNTNNNSNNNNNNNTNTVATNTVNYHKNSNNNNNNNQQNHSTESYTTLSSRSTIQNNNKKDIKESTDSNNATIEDEETKQDRLTKEQEIIRVTEQLLFALTSGDFETFSRLSDSKMTYFEPESLGNLVEGIDFHKFYFDNWKLARSDTVVTKNNQTRSHVNTTVLHPTVHLLSDDAACIAYIRLTQFMDRDATPKTVQHEETRVWHKKNGKWVNVHCHRSLSNKTS